VSFATDAVVSSVVKVTLSTALVPYETVAVAVEPAVKVMVSVTAELVFASVNENVALPFASVTAVTAATVGFLHATVIDTVWLAYARKKTSFSVTVNVLVEPTTALTVVGETVKAPDEIAAAVTVEVFVTEMIVYD